MKSYMQRSTVSSPSSSAIALHWLLAFSVFAQLALGWWMLDVPKSPPGLRAGWFNLHKSVGLTIVFIVLLRVVWRATHPVPQLATLPAWQRAAARLNQALLYVCMLVIPASGFLGSNFTRYPVLFFGHAVPGWNHDWPAAKHLMSSVHYVFVCMLMALLAIHVAAAVWHWLRRDGVAGRVGLPPLRSHPRTAAQ